MAIELASRTTPRAVIIESTFTSMGDMAAAHYPFLPARLLLRHKYPSIDAMKRLTAPVLIAHSEDDEMIPCGHAQQLLDNAISPKRFYRLVGSHNQAFVESGRAYYRALGNFIGNPTASVIDDG